MIHVFQPEHSASNLWLSIYYQMQGCKIYYAWIKRLHPVPFARTKAPEMLFLDPSKINRELRLSSYYHFDPHGTPTQLT